MMTVLDIDLDFFTSPIVKDSMGEDATGRRGETVVATGDALEYLQANCRLPIPGKTPGGCFEHHDEVFDFALRHFTEPVHLIHVDAHSDIGGGIPMCWRYVFTEYGYLSQQAKRNPKRGQYGLGCGNFIVFLAACGLIERITFVTRSDWKQDYSCFYMKDFDESVDFLQLKRIPKEVMDAAGPTVVPWEVDYQVDPEIPFIRVPREKFEADGPPDMLLVTRSPQYTPACSDGLYDALVSLIDPLPTSHSALSTSP